MTDVTLSYPEILIAGNGGVLRQVNALRQRLHDPDSHHRDPMESHVSGAIAEWAVCKYLGVNWEPTVGIRWAGEVTGDVGIIEVRSTSRPNGALIVHDYSFDDRIYLLVLTHRAPVYQLAGWLFGSEAKQHGQWRADVPRPAYFVAQAALRPVEQLQHRDLAVAV